MSTQTDRTTEFRKGLNNVEKYIVLGSSLVLLLVILAFFFIQQAVAAQGLGVDGFYAIFGGLNVAGFMLAVPVTVGLGLQLWRMSLYRRGILSGQLLDYIFTIFLILVSVGVELYVFNWAPRGGISQNLPRIVISAYLLAHVVQSIVEFGTDFVAKKQAEVDAQQQAGAPTQRQNSHRKFREEESEVEIIGESVRRPKR